MTTIARRDFTQCEQMPYPVGEERGLITVVSTAGVTRHVKDWDFRSGKSGDRQVLLTRGKSAVKDFNS